MKKTIGGIIIPVLIISFTGLTSCKDKPKANQKEFTERVQIQTIEKSIEETVSPLPTSAEVLKTIADLEVEYIDGITNPFQNNKKYFTSSKRVINLGVYGADLSYVTLYNKQTAVINYLDAMRSLANELNIAKTYNENMYDEIIRTFNDRDELVRILTDAFDRTYAYLNDNDQQHLALLVLGGAWVEGMYITTHLTYSSYQYAGFSAILLEQKKSFELFLELAQPYSNDSGISDFLKLLEPIKTVYEGFGTSLTEQNIKDITGVITDVRDQIVK